MATEIELEERVSTLKSMDFVVRMMQHEMAYEWWICTVPDQADRDDFLEIVQDDEMWKEVQKEFVNIVKYYGKHGW